MMTGTLPQDLKTNDESDQPISQGTASRFDEVLEDLRHYEESAQTEQTNEPGPSLETGAEETSQAELQETPNPPEDPNLSLSEKERVLRKVLGQKYKQGDEE